MKNRALLTIVILFAASAVAVAAMIHGAGKFEWSWFYPWVLGPYGVLWLIFCLPARQSGARSSAGRVAAALVLTFTCLLYFDAMWGAASSTSALIFVFAPVYLLGGGLVSWGLAWAFFARRTASNDNQA